MGVQMALWPVDDDKLTRITLAAIGLEAQL